MSKSHSGPGVDKDNRSGRGAEAGLLVRRLLLLSVVDEKRPAAVRLERGGQIHGRLDQDWLLIVCGVQRRRMSQEWFSEC